MFKKTFFLISLLFFTKGWSYESRVFRTTNQCHIQTVVIDDYGNGALILIKNKNSVYEGEQKNHFFKKFKNFFLYEPHYNWSVENINKNFPNGFSDLINQFVENEIFIFRIGSSEIENRNYTHTEIASISYIPFTFYVEALTFDGVVTGIRLKDLYY